MNQLLNRVNTKVIELLPKGAGIALNALPTKVYFPILRKLLNSVFHEELKHNELDFLNGKWLKIDVSDINYSFYISQQNKEFILSENQQGDVEFKGDFNQFILLAGLQADPDTLFFNRKLQLTGDTELGLEIKACIENLDREQLPQQINQLLNYHCQLIQNAGAH